VKLIAKHLAYALEMGQTLPVTESLPQPRVVLKGAGATFPYPIYSKWFTNYRRENTGVEITYDPVGSEAGVRRLLAGDLDFGASDSREAIHDIAPGEEGKYVLLPSVVGAVVPIVNLPGLPSEISFTSDALAGIFLGKIKKWNDPVLKKINPRVDLPDLDIVVIHRAEGSGTSYAWTDYLSKTSQEWKDAVGDGLTPKWPTGRGATGNDGVAKLVREMGGSIGYVEYIYALQNHLNYGKVRNRNGEFVEASLESIAASVSHGAQNPDDLNVSIVDAPGAGSYPIATFTWLIVPAHFSDDARRTAVTSFLRWTLGPGQRQAAALGYLALPAALIAKEQAAISLIH
jgi:phosphate transport system substrate-binding protein